MATCDLDQLLEDGACWFCLEPNVVEALELQLLCEIYQAIASATS